MLEEKVERECVCGNIQPEVQIYARYTDTRNKKLYFCSEGCWNNYDWDVGTFNGVIKDGDGER